MEAIAKFAKHNIPEPHELDQDEAIANRMKILIENGLITALVNFGDVKSKNTKEVRDLESCDKKSPPRGVPDAKK